MPSRNRTLRCSPSEQNSLKPLLRRFDQPVEVEAVRDQIINQDFFEIAPHLPREFVDLLILDPPYNLTKNYHGYQFRERDKQSYSAWFDRLLNAVKPTLKPTATIYVCADWKTSVIIAPLLTEHFYVQNRITWEREKGRGAQTNWKNSSEDIWFCTRSKKYQFNVDAVKFRRQVMAPYRTADGQPKDWVESADGNYRLTHPSNIWTDISVPFWSMAENTDHPTQKPEKLIAKLLLASTNAGDFIFDPFLGSGTTAVTAKKLGRHFCGVELNTEYCCWGLKRLQMSEENSTIQGYAEGVFWERNSQYRARRR